MGIFGVLGKVLPWKRKDELGLNANLGLGGFGGAEGGGAPFGQQTQGMQQYPQQQFGGMGGAGGMGGMPQMESFQANQAYERSYAAGKEMEVVSAKLDAIRAALETLNQRLAAIERYIQTEQDFKKRGW